MRIVWSSLMIAGFLFGVFSASKICAQEPKDNGLPQTENKLISVKVEKQTITDSDPLVVELKPLNSLIRNEADLDKKFVRLNVQFLRPNQNHWSSFRVFLNIGKNLSKISLEAPEYIGSTAFYGGEIGKVTSFTFSLNRKLKRLLEMEKLAMNEPLSVTVVPVPARNAKASTSSGFFVREVSIEIEEIR